MLGKRDSSLNKEYTPRLRDRASIKKITYCYESSEEMAIDSEEEFYVSERKRAKKSTRKSSKINYSNLSQTEILLVWKSSDYATNIASDKEGR